MKKNIFLVIIFLSSLAYCSKKHMIKIATLAPEGSEWYYMLVDLGQQWKEATEGRVGLRIYPGGVIGDERDMIRKMRIGQIHGAAITAEGLSELNPDYYMFFVPLLFDCYGEVDFIREILKDDLEEGIRNSGFELIMNNDVGWVNWFTTNPIRIPDDLRNHKIFNWAGDYKFPEIWKKAGFQSVSLSSIDLLPGIQTGLIDAIATNPQFALAQQMFSICNNVLNIKWGLLTGGIIIDSRIFNKINSNDRDEILKISKEFEELYQSTMRHKDDEAINVMKEYNLKVINLNETEINIWKTTVKEWYPTIQNIWENPELFEEILELKKVYKEKIINQDD